MANIKLKDFAATLNKDLNSIIKKIGSPANNMKEIAEIMKEDIIKRTKLGYGVNSSGEAQVKLKPLADSYKKARKKMKLDSSTSPTKSNLTQSGDMLRDLKTTVSQDKFSIGLISQDSKDKAKWNEDKGRSFLNLSKSQIMAITQILKKKVIELLK